MLDFSVNFDNIFTMKKLSVFLIFVLLFLGCIEQEEDGQEIYQAQTLLTFNRSEVESLVGLSVDMPLNQAIYYFDLTNVSEAYNSILSKNIILEDRLASLSVFHNNKFLSQITVSIEDSPMSNPSNISVGRISERFMRSLNSRKPEPSSVSVLENDEGEPYITTEVYSGFKSILTVSVGEKEDGGSFLSVSLKSTQ